MAELFFLLALAAALLLAKLAFPLYQDWIHVPGALIRECKRQGIPECSFSAGSTWTQKSLRPAERSLFQCWDVLLSCNRCNPKIFYISIGKTIRLVVSDSSLLRDLFITNADSYCKPSFVRVLKVLGNGLFTSSGQDWARQKPLILPAFLNAEIKTKVPAMVDCTLAAVKRLDIDIKTEAKQVDIHLFFLDLTLDVLQKTSFGATLPADSRTILKVLNRYLHNRRELLFGLPAVLPGIRFLQKYFHEQLEHDERWISNVMTETIDACRQADTRTRLIELLFTANDSDSITKQELLDNCVTFLLAGHETTASLLTWTFYLLGQHPLWQERARAEVSEFLRESPATWESLTHLKTLSLILMEAARLFPPQPFVGRTCVRENSLAGRKISAGLEIVVPVAAMHRDEDYWGSDADEFRPARFANGISSACSKPMVYMPFGAGQRTCIGQALAMTEAKVVLATLLPKFTWEISESYQHELDITLILQPKFGMPVILKAIA